MLLFTKWEVCNDVIKNAGKLCNVTKNVCCTAKAHHAPVAVIVFAESQGEVGQRLNAALHGHRLVVGEAVLLQSTRTKKLLVTAHPCNFRATQNMLRPDTCVLLIVCMADTR